MQLNRTEWYQLIFPSHATGYGPQKGHAGSSQPPMTRRQAKAGQIASQLGRRDPIVDTKTGHVQLSTSKKAICKAQMASA